MKILYVTTISLTMNAFFKEHIDMLVKEGHQVDIACNYSELPLTNIYKDLKCNMFQIDFSRNPLSRANITAIKQIKSVVKNGNYDIVHCHTPVASFITRLVCKSFKKKEMKVIYTAHGFHFCKGASFVNWMVYYPLEWLCSWITNTIITINHEDYDRASKYMHAKRVKYVHGVGVNTVLTDSQSTDEKRSEFGIDKDARVLVSVGELNKNKNHAVIIKALSRINNNNIHYIVVGEGNLKSELIDLSKSLNIEERVHFLGYRNDVLSIIRCADIFCFPSYREGLPVSLMEAMASGLPVVCSKVRGNVDLIDDGVGGFLCAPSDVNEFVEKIKILIDNKDLCESMSKVNRNFIKNFDIENVKKEMYQIYQEVSDGKS